MRLAFLPALALAACTGDVRTIAKLDVAFLEPTDGATVFSQDVAHVKVRAESNVGVRSIALTVGNVPLGTCTGSDAPVELVCDKEFDPRDFAGQLQGEKLRLGAKATDGEGIEPESASIEVSVKPLRIAFVQPAKNAVLRGTTSLELAVRSEVPVDQIQVTADGVRLRLFTSEPYSGDVDWLAFLGAGRKRLQAEATDTLARTDAAAIEVVVACQDNADCEGGGTCCPSGLCAVACP